MISDGSSSSPAATFSPSRHSAPSRSSTRSPSRSCVHRRRRRPRRAAGCRPARCGSVRRSGSDRRSTRSRSRPRRRPPRRATRRRRDRCRGGRSPRSRRGRCAWRGPSYGGRLGRCRCTIAGACGAGRRRSLIGRAPSYAAVAARPSSSRACARACVGVEVAGEHARQLRDACVVEQERRGSRGCGPAASALATATWASAKAATWGRWVTQNTWW